jgi:hypothetical protein
MENPSEFKLYSYNRHIHFNTKQTLIHDHGTKMQIYDHAYFNLKQILLVKFKAKIILKDIGRSATPA